MSALLLGALRMLLQDFEKFIHTLPLLPCEQRPFIPLYTITTDMLGLHANVHYASLPNRNVRFYISCVSHEAL